ncbi:MAG: putative bifunctional diguanylate cyclase/phosphodiesterase [Pirellulaceae bacterium]
MQTLAMLSTKSRILVADDEPINCDVLAHILRQHGHEVVTVHTGRDVLLQVAQSEFDLVLLDGTMPDMDGFACLAELRRTYTQMQLPVVMVTAEESRDSIVTAYGLGANDFVQKPFDPEVTLARLATHIGLRRSLHALRLSEERYALAAKGANDGLWDWDIVHDTLYLSPRWKEMLGYGEDEIGDSPTEWFSRIHADDRERFLTLVNKSRWERESQVDQEMRMRHRDGSYRWMNCRGILLPDASGRPARMSGSLTDITQGKVGDSLTGLPNRLLFLERLARVCDRRRRLGKGYFAVLFLDLDNFKLVNDSLGHQVGDSLLTAVAARLEKCVRACDVVSKRNTTCTVARLGGDEFTVLLNDLSAPDDAQAVADRIIAAFAEPFLLAGNEVTAGVSIGIAFSGESDQSPEDLLREADTAMYYAKSDGRGRFRSYDPTMHQRATKRLQLEQDLRKAVQGAKDFYLNFQPIVHLATHAIAGFEALVRWNHPRQERVGPDVFIPTAEETGLIVPLGSWVLNQACQQAARWNKQFPDAPPLVISINCSILQLQQAGFTDEVQAMIERTGVAPQSIKLEVTESTLMRKPELVCPVLTRLREMGLRIGIDDFGTGYSSLAYLHRLPLDVLKVDRSFVSTMTDSDESLEIVRTIITLGIGLHLDVVAEGVETDAQRRLLMELGCTHAQGYLFSRPVTAEDAEKMLRHWSSSVPAPVQLPPDGVGVDLGLAFAAPAP